MFLSLTTEELSAPRELTDQPMIANPSPVVVSQLNCSISVEGRDFSFLLHKAWFEVPTDYH